MTRGYSSPLARWLHCGTICIQRKGKRKSICANVQCTVRCLVARLLYLFGSSGKETFICSGKMLHISFIRPRWEIDMNAAASNACTASYCILQSSVWMKIWHISVIWEREGRGGEGEGKKRGGLLNYAVSISPFREDRSISHAKTINP